MTTRNITGINAARRAVGVTAESARDRYLRLGEEAAAVAQNRQADNENFEVARRASDQRHIDELAIIGEEVEQLDFVVNGVDSPDEQVTATVSQESTPTEPQETIGLPATQEVYAPPPNHFNPRGWNWLQWALAVLFAFIAFMIAKATVDWVVSDLQVWDWLLQPLQAVLGTLWHLTMIAVGLFGGALLGFVLMNRWRHRNDPPTATPEA